MRKIEDIIIYQDEQFYAAFPSIIARQGGELLVAFRRAPDRRRFFASHYTHFDPNSHLVLVRSRDGGKTWSSEPELIYAHPLGGSQDPCMLQLDDESLLVASYAWALVPSEGIKHCFPEWANGQVYGWHYTFLGGYLLRSQDNGQSWQGPILPPQLEDETLYFPGIPIPAMNRGALVQARDGNIYWAVARFPKNNSTHSVLECLVSRDKGLSWQHLAPIADDDKVIFNETSLIQTPAGDLVAFARTENFGDQGVVIRSRDGGKSWEPWQKMGITGHPYHALALPDKRVLLVYGYRHEPYGIRARVLDPECTDFSGEEIILRDDGGNQDLGYAWSALVDEKRVLAVYYFNKNDGVRHIAGTLLEIDG